MGVVILPPQPGFYNKPSSVEDIIDFVVGKILNALKIENNLIKPWGE
jgi:4-hydroxy-3-polyprenylbenzoate decarboxylase